MITDHVLKKILQETERFSLRMSKRKINVLSFKLKKKTTKI